MRSSAISRSFWVFALLLIFPAALAADPLSHGLWVWKTATVLDAPQAAQSLRDFCAAGDINEVYASFSARQSESDEARLVACIDLLHHANVRVEALLSSTDADEPGKPRDRFLGHIAEILDFNQRHAGDRLDGIHLDIEPYQRPENKGPDNLRFVPDLVQTYRAVSAAGAADNLPVDADISFKILKADLDQRRQLFSSIRRVTLMLYELSSPEDGQSPQDKSEKLRKSAEKYLDMAYAGLDDPHLAKMSIALRTADYLDQLPGMLKLLDDSFRDNPHYAGWARHSYNDRP
jgi:hypothetical protein